MVLELLLSLQGELVGREVEDRIVLEGHQG